MASAGYDVVSGTNISELAAVCETHRGDLDLVIIGSALPKDEKRRAMGIVRKFCGPTPILELYPHGATPVDEGADEQLPTAGETDVLVAKVGEVLSKKRKKRRAAS